MSALQAEDTSPSHYYEVDFPEVTKKKAAVIAHREALRKLVGPSLNEQDVGKLSAFCGVITHQVAYYIAYYNARLPVASHLGPSMPVCIKTYGRLCPSHRARENPVRLVLSAASGPEGSSSTPDVLATCWLPAKRANICPV